MDLFGNGTAGAATGNVSNAEATTGAAGKPIDLRDKIDMSGCYSRNEASGFPMTNLFIGDSRLGCKSDSDEQLILHIAFNEFVKIRSLEIIEFNNGVNPEMNPNIIHLFVNRENLGFEDCDDVDPTQTIELPDASSMKNLIPLKFVKFQRVKSLTLYIADNHGGDVTAIGGLKIHGFPVDTVNMNDFKKQQEM